MKKTTFNIISQCSIDDNKAVVNGQVICQRSSESDWYIDIYRSISMQYPKFFKMDNLCKAGIVAAEMLLKDIDFDRLQVKDNWAIILMNSASSLDDDRRYQQTIASTDNYYPSPAIFVYTLANIVTGEIAIRHKIGGESSFYIFKSYSEKQMSELIKQAFLTHPTLTHIICGWVEVDTGKTDIQMQLVTR